MRKVYQITKVFYDNEEREGGIEIGGIYKVNTEEKALKAYEKQYGKAEELKGLISGDARVELI